MVKYLYEESVVDQDLPSGARLIVGVDESPAARWALAWAIGAARLHRMALVAVHVSRAPVHPFPEALPVQHAIRQGEEERCGEVVARAFDDVAGGVPDDLTTAAVATGRRSRLSPGRSGTRRRPAGARAGRRGLVSRLFLPSTSMYCARHARATVVIVRQPVPPDDPQFSGERARRFWGRRHYQ